MYKNNLFKLSLNSTQITKIGMHVGGKVSNLDVSNFPYLCGSKHKTSYIDISETILNLKKLCFLQKKIILKSEPIVLLNSNKDKIKKSLNQNINADNLFNTKVLNNFRFGLVSNNEVRSRFLVLKKNKDYGMKNNFFISSTTGAGRKNYHNFPKSSNYNYPNLLILLGYDKNVLSEFKGKNIITSCILDTNNFNYVSDYNILFNNKSIVSLNYFSKIFKV